MVAADLPNGAAVAREAREIKFLAAARPEPDAAASIDGALGEQPHDRAGGDRLARSALAHNAEHFALVDMVGHAIDCLHQAFAHGKVYLHIVQFEQALGGHGVMVHITIAHKGRRRRGDHRLGN
ncbi:hypothetical protein D9M68_893950 [compost metagenome]